VTVYLITGSDSRLVSSKLTDLTTDLIGDGDRNTMFESHDLESVTADERESAIANAVMGAQTESLFGDQRVVVLRGLQEATVDQLKPLVKYLERPLDVTHLVITAEGKLAKSTTDALKAAGATTFNTSPPSRKNDLTTWFMEQFTEAGLKLDSAAVASIIEWLGQDQARLPSLIDVLSSTYGTAKKLNSSDVEPFLGDQGSVLPILRW
jgi:DNA polymerase III delta subunit